MSKIIVSFTAASSVSLPQTQKNLDTAIENIFVKPLDILQG